MKRGTDSSPPHQRGFAAILAIIILVVLASLAAGLVTLGTTQQLTSAEDVQSARAWGAAGTGLNAGMFRAMSSQTPADSWKTCSSAGVSMFLDLSASTGFHVAVQCWSQSYNEGETTPGVPNVVRIFTIQATACNSSSACPDSTMTTSPNYVERVRQVTVTN